MVTLIITSTGLRVLITLLSILGPFTLVCLIVNETEALHGKHRVKSKEIYDLLKVSLSESSRNKTSHDVYYIRLNDVLIRKIPSVFFPYEIGDLGYIGRWSKSGRLLKSLWLTKRETLALKRKNQIDKFWDKQKNKKW